MALKHLLAGALWLGLVAGLVLLAREFAAWQTLGAYNDAIAREAYAEAPTEAAYGHFAQAYAAHLSGDYQAARVRYGELEQVPDPVLRRAVLYNAGNTYMQQAAAIDRDSDADRALPLIELAKQSYRAALRLDPELWPARYNLERALQWSPDVGEQRLMDLKGRPSAVRTIITADPEGDLP